MSELFNYILTQERMALNFEYFIQELKQGMETKFATWKEQIQALKRKFPDIHFFYSSEDGWANLTYRTNTISIKQPIDLDDIIGKIIKLRLQDENTTTALSAD